MKPMPLMMKLMKSAGAVAVVVMMACEQNAGRADERSAGGGHARPE